MSDETGTIYKLVDRARPLGFFVGMHAHFDPTIPARGGGKSGPFYLMRRNPGQKNESLLRYATAEMIEDFLQQQVEDYAK